MRVWSGTPTNVMTDDAARADAARGRRQVYLIAALVWLPSLIRLLLNGVDREGGWLWAVLVPALVVVGLLRGWSWARTATVVLLGVSACFAAAGTFLAPTVGKSASPRFTRLRRAPWFARKLIESRVRCRTPMQG